MADSYFKTVQDGGRKPEVPVVYLSKYRLVKVLGHILAG